MSVAVQSGRFPASSGMLGAGLNRWPSQRPAAEKSGLRERLISGQPRQLRTFTFALIEFRPRAHFNGSFSVLASAGCAGAFAWRRRDADVVCLTSSEETGSSVFFVSFQLPHVHMVRVLPVRVLPARRGGWGARCCGLDARSAVGHPTGAGSDGYATAGGSGRYRLPGLGCDAPRTGSGCVGGDAVAAASSVGAARSGYHRVRGSRYRVPESAGSGHVQSRNLPSRTVSGSDRCDCLGGSHPGRIGADRASGVVTRRASTAAFSVACLALLAYGTQ